jgi:hypothetical protein
MTEEFKKEMPSIGKHCVKISNPKEFYRLVTNRLKVKFKVTGSWLGHVCYENPQYSGTDPEPGPIGFVKPPDAYKDQKEVRALWTVYECHHPLKPFSLPCSDITKLRSSVNKPSASN